MSWCMRTTLTLDDDVAALLAKVQRQKKATFKEVVNTALRVGLDRMTAAPKRTKLFETSVADLGRCRIGSLDDIADALAIAEGESFR